MRAAWARLMVALGRLPHRAICDLSGHRWEYAWDRCSRCGITGTEFHMRRRR